MVKEITDEDIKRLIDDHNEKMSKMGYKKHKKGVITDRKKTKILRSFIEMKSPTKKKDK